MIKKIVLNIVLLVGGCFFPWYVLYRFQNDTIKMEHIQVPMLLILFTVSILLTYLNNQYRKQVTAYKWLWFVFIIVGIIGLFYSGFILFLIFSFRHLLT